MLLPGSNELILCDSALIAMVENHLNANSYERGEGKIEVTGVRYADNAYRFMITNKTPDTSAPKQS